MKLTTDWDLTQIYKTEEVAKQAFNEIKELYLKKLKFKSKLNTKENILNLLKLSELIESKEMVFLQYLGMRQCLNGTDTFAQNLELEYEYFVTEMSPKLSFVLTELLKNSSKQLLEYAKLPEFKNYNLELEDLVLEKKHILNKTVRDVLSQNMSFGAFGSIFENFNNVDIKFGKVKTDNGEKELTHANYSLLIKNKNPLVRKETFEKMMNAYGNFNYTLGETYLSDVKETVFFSKIHKYKSVLDKSCKNDKTKESVLHKLIQIINKNLCYYHKFNQIKKEYLKLEPYFSYDSRLNLSEVDKIYSYEESVEIVLKALNILGDEYSDVLKHAFTNNWIDVYEKENKRPGGFCAPIYGKHPFILLNHVGTFNDVSTIAHEMGHALNEYYSCKSQPFIKSMSETCVGEVSSIVNEIILYQYMIKNAKTNKEKMFFIHELLAEMNASVFVQTMYSEFELFVYSSVENQKIIKIEDLNNKWLELIKKYNGERVEVLDCAKFGWSQIPHFYMPYYVYKYATGFISASIIAKNILSGDKDYLNKYIEFLSAGSSKKPLELLKMVDVDIDNEKTLDNAFIFYNDLLEELEKLTKEN